MTRLRGTGQSQAGLIFVSLFVSLHHKPLIKNGARCRFRTCDPYRVKVMLYH